MQLNRFEQNFDSTILKGDRSHNHCNTVILHGAGKSSRIRFSKLRKELHDRGLLSMSFDFIGHGETMGKITDTSLYLRTKQAQTVIDNYAENFSMLIGSSMSAYTAIKLTTVYEVKNLVLMVPAVYNSKAYKVQFGSEFSEIIREKNSWQDSDAFEILRKFTGNLLIIAAQNDKVIPHTVVEKIFNSAICAKSKKLHIINDAEHINLFPTEHDFENVVEMLALMGNE